MQNVTGPWTESAVAAEGRAGKTHVATLPFDLRSFWRWFFTQQKGFGMAVYEQDFLYTQYDRYCLGGYACDCMPEVIEFYRLERVGLIE